MSEIDLLALPEGHEWLSLLVPVDLRPESDTSAHEADVVRAFRRAVAERRDV